MAHSCCIAEEVATKPWWFNEPTDTKTTEEPLEELLIPYRTSRLHLGLLYGQTSVLSGGATRRFKGPRNAERRHPVLFQFYSP